MIDQYTVFLARESGKARPRTVGSCRFSPYFKAQWYDKKTLAWREIAERFTTEEEAQQRFSKRKQWRVMEVSMDGRRVL